MHYLLRLTGNCTEGRFRLEDEELLSGRGLFSASDKLRFRWQFLGGCEWACLSPWVSVQSEDCRYWNCETRERVQDKLALKYWDTKLADDITEWVDEKRGSVTFMETSSVILV